MKGRRVVITGVGPVTAAGVGRDDFVAALQTGRSGIKPLALFDVTDCAASLAGTIDSFDVQPLLKSRKAFLDRSSRFALGATALAIQDAGLTEDGLKGAGIAMGTAFGSTETAALFFEGFLEKGPRLVKPFLFQHTYANTAIGLSAIEFGLNGPHLNMAGGMTASGSAIAAACDLVAIGTVDRMIAGGHEALTEQVYTGYDLLGALGTCTTPSEATGPRGAERDGFIPGEGAGMVVIEALDAAVARGATIYAEVTGIGMAGNLELALRAALQDADSGAPIASVFATANGSITLDDDESRVLDAILPAQPEAPVVVTSKSLTGEMLGASGASQIIAASQTLTPAGATALVNMVDPGGDAICMLLRKGAPAS